MLQLNQLTKIYRNGAIQVRALVGVTLSIKKGEMTAIMGPSGSGKSTFMNILGCLDQATSGSYLLNRHEVAKLSQREQAVIRNRTDSGDRDQESHRRSAGRDFAVVLNRGCNFELDWRYYRYHLGKRDGLCNRNERD